MKSQPGKDLNVGIEQPSLESIWATGVCIGGSRSQWGRVPGEFRQGV